MEIVKENFHSTKYLVSVVGPTAVGKTDLCIRLAKAFQTEIISADSRQFYKEMLIGTAKPTAEEMQGVPHHFIDSHSIIELYSVGKFERDALELVENLFGKYDLVILTGGSGLYLKALLEGLDDVPEGNLEVRTQLNQRFAKEGIEPLQKELEKLDPDYYREVDLQNPQRIIRALEVCLTTQKPFSRFRKQSKKERPFRTLKIGLNRERAELYERINLRMDLMLEGGLLEEAKSLYSYKEHNALQTVGYQEIFGFLEQEYDWEETVRLLKRNSRRYAKRQLTWFRRDEQITWFHPDDFEEIFAFLQAQIQT